MGRNVYQGVQSAAYSKPQKRPTPRFLPASASHIAHHHQTYQQEGRMEQIMADNPYWAIEIEVVELLSTPNTIRTLPTPFQQKLSHEDAKSNIRRE